MAEVATIAIALALLLIGPAARGQVDQPTLIIELNCERRHFSAAELLANPATRVIEIPQDADYTRPMRYQAIPLLDLLHGLPTGMTHTLEARAIDGFASQIPWTLIARASRHQILVLRTERLAKKLLEAQRKYPRLAKLIEMEKDRQSLNHRIANEAKV